MATKNTQVTEPARGSAELITEPDSGPSVTMIYVQDTNTGEKLTHPVPENWLRQFPNLKQVPSDKARTATQKDGK